ncbi:hypothetical protein CALVIDRAFT_307565 [Calocera viscosa TUFC12733]|uniref:Uncharacterized protein n=1 Tax=Calocera viscosa (strain TUFC12733) TaxID=1330018 RepID=A0A167ICC9_CALVF|nr:hypothetical protein CALVIDRAFT_307565 [Calocera viscosa TUFC12733]
MRRLSEPASQGLMTRSMKLMRGAHVARPITTCRMFGPRFSLRINDMGSPSYVTSVHFFWDPSTISPATPRIAAPMAGILIAIDENIANSYTWEQIMAWRGLRIAPQITADIASQQVTHVVLAAALFQMPGSLSPRANWRLYFLFHTPDAESAARFLELKPEIINRNGRDSVFFQIDFANPEGATTLETIPFGTLRPNPPEAQFPTVDELVRALISHGLYRWPIWQGDFDGYFPWCFQALRALAISSYLARDVESLAMGKRSSLQPTLARRKV